MNHVSGRPCEDKLTSQFKKNYLNKSCEERKETHKNPFRAKYETVKSSTLWSRNTTQVVGVHELG
jgi:predicted transcriptional regulator YheO